MAAAALVIGAVAATAPAWAASTGGATSVRLAGHVRPTVRVQPGGLLALHRGRAADVRAGTATSNNWSGFAATGSTYKSVSASWVEPNVSCSGGGLQVASFWVGIDGDGSNSVEQTGSQVACQNGQAQQSAWWEMFPAGSVSFPNAVKAGDHFTASVTHVSGNTYKLVLADKTAGWSHTLTKTANAQNASAEAIVEAPSSGGILPLANFGTANFTSVKVNGAAIGKTAHTRIIMVDSSGNKEDNVSKLSGGAAFSAHWLRSN